MMPYARMLFRTRRVNARTHDAVPHTRACKVSRVRMSVRAFVCRCCPLLYRRMLFPTPAHARLRTRVIYRSGRCGSGGLHGLLLNSAPSASAASAWARSSSEPDERRERLRRGRGGSDRGDDRRGGAEASRRDRVKGMASTTASAGAWVHF